MYAQPIHRKKIFVVALLLALTGCGTPPQTAARLAAQAEGVERTVTKGSVTFTVRAAPKRPRLSDLVTFELLVRCDPDVVVKAPSFGKGVQEFAVRDYVELAPQIEDGKTVRRFRYKLEPQQSGRLLLRSQQLEYVDKREKTEPGKRTFIASEPLEINVVSDTEGKEVELANLAPMAEPVALHTGSMAWWAIIVSSALAAAIAALFVVKRRRVERTIEIVRTAEEIARAELEALLKTELVARKEFKEFYVQLTGVVRRYIERRTGIHAPEQTTEEFLRDPETRKTFTFDKAERLANFLESADLVKYAALEPGTRQIDEAVTRAKEFIGMPTQPVALAA